MSFLGVIDELMYRRQSLGLWLSFFQVGIEWSSFCFIKLLLLLTSSFFFFLIWWLGYCYHMSAVCFQKSRLLNLDTKEWERCLVSGKLSGSWEGPVGVVHVDFWGAGRYGGYELDLEIWKDLKKETARDLSKGMIDPLGVVRGMNGHLPPQVRCLQFLCRHSNLLTATSWICLLNSLSNPVIWGLFFPPTFFKWRNWRLKKWNDLPKVRQLVGDKALNFGLTVSSNNIAAREPIKRGGTIII